MHNFDFIKLRQAFIIEDLFLLDIHTDELLQFLLSSSYLKSNLYYHPLGFVYSKLHEFENNESIRIHIWDNEYYNQTPTMDIHNHYYIVNSFLFEGCIKNNVYGIDEKNGTEYAIYEGGYNKDEDRVLRKSEKTIHLTLKGTDIHCKKELYQIPYDTVHAGHPIDNKLVCTIVYTEKPGIPQPLVVGPLMGEIEYYFPTKLVEDETVEKILSKITLSRTRNI
ncbi:MAG: hypothetical protein WC622_03465 [Pedobacter sp.]|jgi:hypothetical protein|uniref:hypothetical protein n=1 Tax=Pedobacter sp. TaxID=1411316 RepID=UPI003562E985